MTKRILVAAVAGPLILYSPFAGIKFFTLFIFAVSFLGSKEISGFYRHKGIKLNTAAPYLTSLLPLFFYQYGTETMMSFSIVFLIFLFTVEIFRDSHKASVIISSYAFMIIYTGIFPSLLIGVVRETVPVMFLYIYGVIIATDTFAYFGGLSMKKLFKTHKLLEKVSPKKTIEGSVTGIIAAVAAGYFIREYSDIRIILPLQSSLILSASVSVLGQAGDLFESKIKRDFNLKDSSKLIPGHGGILDRFDSLIFTAPAVYLYVHYFTM